MLSKRVLMPTAAVVLVGLIVTVFVLLGANSPSSATEQTATEPSASLPADALGQGDALARHKDTIQRVIAEAFNAGDAEAVQALYAEEFIAHLPPSEIERPELSRADLYEIVLLLHNSVPDLVVTSELLLAEGDYVVVQARLRGTFSSEFYDYPPTGDPLDLVFTVIHRFDAAGAIAEAWVTYDTLALRQQFGLESGE